MPVPLAWRLCHAGPGTLARTASMRVGARLGSLRMTMHASALRRLGILLPMRVGMRLPEWVGRQWTRMVSDQIT